MPIPYENNLDHLKDELARLDLLIRRVFQRFQSTQKKNELSGLYISDKEVQDLLSQSVNQEEVIDTHTRDALSHSIEQKTELNNQRVSESPQICAPLEISWRPCPGSLR